MSASQELRELTAMVSVAALSGSDKEIHQMVKRIATKHGGKSSNHGGGSNSMEFPLNDKGKASQKAAIKDLHKELTEKHGASHEKYDGHLYHHKNGAETKVKGISYKQKSIQKHAVRVDHFDGKSFQPKRK